jgi:NADH-quinone oxidoreductase subunit N
MPPTIPTIQWWPTLPILLVAATGVLILLADLVVAQRGPMFSLFISIVGMGAALIVVANGVSEDAAAFGQFVRYDFVGRWGAMIVLACGCLVALISPRTVQLYELPPAEYYALLVFAVFGMLVLCISVELFTIFLSVEIVAVAIYILAGLMRNSSRSAEAALKYFILGAFSGGFLIFGFVFLYGGAGGSSVLGEIGLSIMQIDSLWETGCLVLGLALALAGFAFKLTLVPFHLYAADVFEGAPTPVATLLATGSKVAGFVALIHVLTPLHQHLSATLRAIAADVGSLLWLLAALSIVVGNVVALLQRNVKRMLAYSSIAHSGYLLMAAVVFVEGSVKLAQVEFVILVYLIAYVLMKVVAFGVAATLGARGEGNIEDYAGLAQQSPRLAFLMAIAMLSLTGIPGTIGFVGKFYIFARAIEAGFVMLVILAVLGSVVSAYYYLRVIVFMYMRDPTGEATIEPATMIQRVGLLLAAVPIVILGVFPQMLVALLSNV